MYRNYKDVARSYLRQWGIRKGVEELRTIVENERGNWRSETVPATARKLVLDHFSENIDPYDAAVLFWYVRNSLFFELELDENPNLLMCEYEDFVTSPSEVIRNTYKAIGCNYPGHKIVKKIHPKSINKGKDIELSPDIEGHARELWSKLEAVHRNKQQQLEQEAATGT
jgi:hypothetical protein